MADFPVSWPAILSLLAGVASLFLARWVWTFRERPGATYWTGVQLALAVWALAYGLALTVFDPAVRGLFEPVLWFARTMTPPLILLFALDYTGRGRLANSRFAVGLLGYWVLAFLFYMTNHVHHLGWTDYRVVPVFGAAAADFVPQVGLYAISTSAYVFIGIAVVLILGPLVSYEQLFGRQATAIVVVLAFPTVANVAWLFRLGPTRHLDLTPIMFLVTFAGMSYALFREELFEFLPATTQVATDIAIDDINAAVLTVSPSGRLIDLNTTAATLFDADRSKALGRPVEEALAVDIPLEATNLSISNPSGQHRKFDVDVSPIDSGAGNLVGYVITFYEITEERRRQQRLAVQNRVLRHNLRNGLTVVEGNAGRIERMTEDRQVKALVENIKERSADLIRLSEKARRFDAALSDESESVDVGHLCQAVVDEMRERYPEAEIGFDAAGTGTVDGQERLLRQVIEEAVENAVVHDESETPRVELRLEVLPDQLRLSVEDTGPGIPTAEVEAIKRGDEGPLTHGTGIGLWIIEWGTSVLGGSVVFEPGECGGTTVSIRLPRN